MLNGKTGVVLGVANKRSIGWAIARAADGAGARLAITYQNERFLRGVEGLAAELQTPPVLIPCDVGDDAQLQALTERLGEDLGGLDFLAHALAFAPKEELEGGYSITSRDGFRKALDISTYSFTALARHARPLMEGRAGSLLTLTYIGGERVVPHYNVMGVAKAALESSVRYLAYDLGAAGHRVNAISAGPIKTLAASGISGFSRILDEVAAKAPLRRNVEPREVAEAAVFLLSPAASGITGEVLHVDCGYNVLGIA